LALYGAITAILIAVVADRLLQYMEIAERAAMEATINHVNSGVNVRLALYGLGGEYPDIAGSNPFELARMAPANFLGETSIADVRAGGGAVWVYDRLQRELIYVPRLTRRLDTNDRDGAIRFQLTRRVPGNAYMLVPTSKYRWE
jgi:hypothetical protein